MWRPLYSCRRCRRCQRLTRGHQQGAAGQQRRATQQRTSACTTPHTTQRCAYCVQVRTLANLGELTVRLLESRAGLARLLREEQLVKDAFSLLRWAAGQRGGQQCC